MILVAHSELLADMSPKVFAFAALVGMMLAFALFLGIAMILKRTLFQEDESDLGTFTLADLRALHDDGKLSGEEYEAAKASVLDHMNQQAKTGKQERH